MAYKGEFDIQVFIRGNTYAYKIKKVNGKYTRVYAEDEGFRTYGAAQDAAMRMLDMNINVWLKQ